MLRSSGDVFHQHGVEDAHRVEEANGWVDHQHFFEPEQAFFLIQFRHVGRLGGPQAVAGEVEVRDLDAAFDLVPGQPHHPVEVPAVVDQVAGHHARRGGHDEIGDRRRRQADHVKARLVKQPLHELHLAGAVAGAGAGDDEDQRRFALLAGEGIAQPLRVPEDIGDLAVREDPKHKLLHRDILGQKGLVIARGAQDGRIVGVHEGVVIGDRGGRGDRGGQHSHQGQEVFSHTVSFFLGVKTHR